MFAALQLPLLWAADNRILKLDLPSFGAQGLQISALALIVLGLFVLSFGIGIWFASAVRMKDYGWKVGLILAAFTCSLAICLLGQYKLGVDLQGGVILVYEVNENETKEKWSMSRLVAVLGDRLNESGLKEIIVRPFGPKQVEIVVPEVDQQEVEKLKQRITTGGMLQFMVVASEVKDAQLFETAREQSTAIPTEGKEGIRTQRAVLNEDGKQIGFWARAGRETSEDPDTAPLRDPSVISGLIRDARTGEIIDLPRDQNLLSSPPAFLAYLEQRGIKQIDALMVFDSDYEIRGDKDLGPATSGRDESLRPAIFFTTRGDGVQKMGSLTAENLDRKLAIIFDNELKSAPVIRDKISGRGEITGEFTQDDVDFMVDILKSGSLPVVLHDNPISDNTIGAILGMDTIRKGSWSIVGALLAVLVFLIGYYRFAGLVAGFALTLNLLLTIAFMVIFQAPFTLPGLAGLVLTVGMSVDANVLIFERMREEQARGATLRMTIRNGFDRALSAIIDGNLSTLLTALVLYAIGTDQVRGFGATLIIGNLTSMFTAIFCARVIFDVAERTRWLSKLSMTQLLPTPSIDWCRYLAPSMVASAIVILIGLGATAARGKGLFDIDLVGGTSVAYILKEPLPDDQVRAKLDAVLSKLTDPATKGAVSWSVNEVKVDTEAPETVYKVDSSLPEVNDLKAKIREAFRQGDQDGLKTFRMSVGNLDERKIETPAAEATPPATTTAPPTTTPATTTSPPTVAPPPPQPELSKPGPAEPPAPTEPARTEPAPTEPAPTEPAPTEPAPAEPKPEEKPGEEKPEGCQEQPETEAAKTEETPAADAPVSEVPASPAPTSPAPAVAAADEPGIPPAVLEAPSISSGAPAASAPPAEQYETTVVLNFPQSAITETALRERLTTSASLAVNVGLPHFPIDNPAWNNKDNSAFEQWTVKLPLSKERTQQVLDRMQTDLEKDVVWQASSKIGGQVSVDTRWRAIGAIAVSLLGILAYVWFRFHQAVWGVAAIVALAHDALVMLGGIAISYWLVDALGWAQVEEFKISLPVVAAFLTLIGYSVNDTIVIFDRIREIRGKSPHLTAKMINDSVNQTLSRTIITGGLVLMVVTVLYFLGGSGIHAFAFALLVGVISGSYSTVFIAAPLLLWLLGDKRPQPAATTKREMAKSA